MADNRHYTLTPADVMELRESLRWRLADKLGENGGPTSIPFIRLSDDDQFVIHSDGHRRAITPRIEVAAACLRAEQARPGFLIDIMDARFNCDEALLDPAEQAKLRSRRLFEEKAASVYAAEQAAKAATVRRQSTPRQPTPSNITLSDLFDD